MSNRERLSIEDQVKRVVGGHLGLPTVSLNLGDRIGEDLGADSLDQLELIMTVEELFSVSIGFDRAEGIRTLADLVQAVEGGADPSPGH